MRCGLFLFIYVFFLLFDGNVLVKSALWLNWYAWVRVIPDLCNWLTLSIEEIVSDLDFIHSISLSRWLFHFNGDDIWENNGDGKQEIFQYPAQMNLDFCHWRKWLLFTKIFELVCVEMLIGILIICVTCLDKLPKIKESQYKWTKRNSQLLIYNKETVSLSCFIPLPV